MPPLQVFADLNSLPSLPAGEGDLGGAATGPAQVSEGLTGQTSATSQLVQTAAGPAQRFQPQNILDQIYSAELLNPGNPTPRCEIDCGGSFASLESAVYKFYT
jgi:hypothetical protein